MKFFRFLSYLLVITGLLSVLYYSREIINARRYTYKTVLPNEQAAIYPLEVTSFTERQLDILLKVEDPDFFHHKGVDFTTPGAGITTITQGLVKHLYFQPFKPGIAKIRQTLIARFALDPLMDKDMQLRRFINTVYLGEDIRGFEEAANTYYAKQFAELTEDEYISLVAMIIAPTTFNIKIYPQRNQERTQRIKGLVDGDYAPKGLFDLYYGKLNEETRKNIPMISYFENYYE